MKCKAKQANANLSTISLIYSQWWITVGQTVKAVYRVHGLFWMENRPGKGQHIIVRFSIAPILKVSWKLVRSHSKSSNTKHAANVCDIRHAVLNHTMCSFTLNRFAGSVCNLLPSECSPTCMYYPLFRWVAPEWGRISHRTALRRYVIKILN